MTRYTQIKRRLSKLEVRLASTLRPKKQFLPDFLRHALEEQGYIVDEAAETITPPPGGPAPPPDG